MKSGSFNVARVREFEQMGENRTAIAVSLAKEAQLHLNEAKSKVEGIVDSNQNRDASLSSMIDEINKASADIDTASALIGRRIVPLTDLKVDSERKGHSLTIRKRRQEEPKSAATPPISDQKAAQPSFSRPLTGPGFGPGFWSFTALYLLVMVGILANWFLTISAPVLKDANEPLDFGSWKTFVIRLTASFIVAALIFTSVYTSLQQPTQESFFPYLAAFQSGYGWQATLETITRKTPTAKM
jgi:hypothetical protein